MLQKQEM